MTKSQLNAEQNWSSSLRGTSIASPGHEQALKGRKKSALMRGNPTSEAKK